MEYKKFIKSFGKEPIQGIYAISCFLNGKVYIGSTVNIRRRMWQHITAFNSGKHDNKEMQMIYNRSKLDYFDFNLIEKVENHLDLLDREVIIQEYFSINELFNATIKSKHIILNDRYLEKFWNWIKIGKDDECWQWIGPKQKNGYGQFHVWENNKVKVFLPHRIFYTLYYNKQIGQKIIDHNCNNRLCVNPNHLELASHHKNMNACSKRGRYHGQKYSEELIKDIRQKQKNDMSAGEIFQYLQSQNIKMSYQYMCNILCGAIRKNVKVP